MLRGVVEVLLRRRTSSDERRLATFMAQTLNPGDTCGVEVPDKRIGWIISTSGARITSQAQLSANTSTRRAATCER